MVTVQRWSGREARLLRDALRMSLRDFAAYLGVSDGTVSNWEGGGASYQPRAESQAVLDTALGRASGDAKARFAAALGTSDAIAPVAGRIEVDSHKFLPVFIGVERAGRLRAHMTPSVDDQWLESSSARVDRPQAQDCVHDAEGRAADGRSRTRTTGVVPAGSGGRGWGLLAGSA
ncbi:hypothetical protein GCM10020367_49200 [Streptomyces sannanensis]|uniref:HTH cro/C1-type domain-containing protein n=1 Tax=Streptomyces sannanensis TaxID=285536 RepID=A0ABP6SHR2_9ACTN